MEAERDFNIACFWERTGHPGSAHFYYEIVRRRYPGTPYADKAAKKVVELEARAIKEAERAQQPPGPWARLMTIPWLSDAKQPAQMPQEVTPAPATEAGPAPRTLTPGQPMPGAGTELGPAPRPLPPNLAQQKRRSRWN
jgi:hypothetical protein